MARVRVPKSAYGLADQVVSSLTNFLGVIAASRVLAPTDLGTFGVASAVMMGAIGLNRAGVGEPLAIEIAPAEHGRRRAIVAEASSSSLIGSLVLAVALALGSLLAPGTFGSAGYVAAVFLPLLLVHDTWRYACSAAHHTIRVLVSDSVWLVAVVVGSVMVRAGDDGEAMMIWLLGLVPALVVLMSSADIAIASPTIEFVRRHRAFVMPVVLAFGLVVFTGNLLPFVIGVFGEIEIAGQYRLLQTVFGPVGVLVQASSLVGLPILARRRGLGLRSLVTAAAGIGVVLAVAAVVWGAVLVALPEDAGTDAFGSSWPQVRSALPLMVVFFLLQTIGFGALLLLKAVNDGAAVLRARLVVGPALLIGALGGLAAGASMESMLTGMSIAGVLSAGVWLVVARRSMRAWAEPVEVTT